MADHERVTKCGFCDDGIITRRVKRSDWSFKCPYCDGTGIAQDVTT